MNITCPECDENFLAPEQNAGPATVGQLSCPRCRALLKLAVFDGTDDSPNSDPVWIVVEDAAEADDDDALEYAEEDVSGKPNGRVIVTATLAVLLLSGGIWARLNRDGGFVADATPPSQQPSQRSDRQQAEDGPAFAERSPKTTGKVVSSAPLESPPAPALPATAAPQKKLSTYGASVSPLAPSSKQKISADSPIVIPEPPAVVSLQAVDIKLPGPVVEVVPGGSGKYMVTRLTTPEEVRIVDVVQKQVVATIEAEGVECMAADIDRLYLFRSAEHEMTAHRLSDGAPLSSFRLPDDQHAVSAVAGVSSRGTVLMASTGPGVFQGRDRPSMSVFLLHRNSSECHPVNLTIPQIMTSKAVQLRASEDGRAIAMWPEDVTPAGLAMLKFDASFQRLDQQYLRTTAGIVTPRNSGDLWLAENFRIGTPSVTFPAIRGTGSAVSAVVGSLMIAPDLQRPRHLTIFGPTGTPALASVTGPFPDRWPQSAPGTTSVPLDGRIHFVPHLQRLAIVQPNNKTISLCEFDPSEHLNQSAAPLLAVLSSPPSTVLAGKTLNYDLKTLCNFGVPKCHLDFGPPAAILSEAGRLTWTVPVQTKIGDETNSADSEFFPFVVSIQCGKDHQIFHAFTCTVLRPDEDF